MEMSTRRHRAAADDRGIDIAETAVPPLAPGQHAIDLAQLSRMTLGERSLEQEVLALFNLQAGILLARIRHAAPDAVAGLAHTLTGSARGVGAWDVAAAAEKVEQLASGPDAGALDAAVGRLSAAVIEAQAAIAELQRGH
jgi:HPt (histidine-containing phosphotransfer) domain-containing protein